jgi:hypothetical protein
LTVVTDARVYHVTSSRPELLGVRSAGRKDNPPLCGRRAHRHGRCGG